MFRRAWAMVVLGMAVIITAVVVIVVRSGDSSSTAQAQPAPAAQPGRSPAPQSPPPATIAPSRSLPPAPSPTATPTVAVRGHHGQREPHKARLEAKDGPITYTVKPGDNLWSIARWFHLHGYGALYRWNRSVIGDNPALIFPGQKITVSAAGNTTSK